MQFKLEEFLKNKDDYTTLILGSSLSYRNVNPLLLDEILSKNGIASRSFNLALPAAGFQEAHFLFEKIMEAKPKKLSLILVDARYTYAGASGTNWSTRDLYWHGPEQTLQSLEYWRLQKKTTTLGAGLQMLKETEALALNSLLWGRGAGDILGQAQALDAETAWRLQENAGFMALDWEAAEWQKKKNQHWLKNPDQQIFPKADPAETPLGVQFDYTAMAEATSRVGAKLIVHRPVVIGNFRLNCLPPLCTEVDFKDREKHPPLYDTRMFFDRRHYNLAGAGEYTKALAEKIILLNGKTR